MLIFVPPCPLPFQASYNGILKPTTTKEFDCVNYIIHNHLDDKDSNNNICHICEENQPSNFNLELIVNHSVHVRCAYTYTGHNSQTTFPHPSKTVILFKSDFPSL